MLARYVTHAITLQCCSVAHSCTAFYLVCWGSSVLLMRDISSLTGEIRKAVRKYASLHKLFLFILWLQSCCKYFSLFSKFAAFLQGRSSVLINSYVLRNYLSPCLKSTNCVYISINIAGIFKNILIQLKKLECEHGLLFVCPLSVSIPPI